MYFEYSHAFQEVTEFYAKDVAEIKGKYFIHVSHMFSNLIELRFGYMCKFKLDFQFNEKQVVTNK